MPTSKQTEGTYSAFSCFSNSSLNRFGSDASHCNFDLSLVERSYDVTLLVDNICHRFTAGMSRDMEQINSG